MNRTFQYRCNEGKFPSDQSVFIDIYTCLAISVGEWVKECFEGKLVPKLVGKLVYSRNPIRRIRYVNSYTPPPSFPPLVVPLFRGSTKTNVTFCKAKRTYEFFMLLEWQGPLGQLAASMRDVKVHFILIR